MEMPGGQDRATESRLAHVRWLCGPDSPAVLAAAERVAAANPRDPLAAATALRRLLPDLDPDLAGVVLEQARLRALAADRYAMAADHLLLTRDGLEQATRPDVARHRAALIRGSGARRVLDLTGGLGLDVAAFLAEGLAVTAIERDPATALLLAHNCPSATVVVADASAPGVLDAHLAAVDDADVVFVDPARRDPAGPRDRRTGRSRPERDPARWSPPWPFVQSIEHPRVAAKVSPSFSPPDGWHAEWVSVHRTVVECAVYSWPAFAAPRRAVIVSSDAKHTEEAVLDAGTAPPPPIATIIDAWLHEPDPAVVRAAAVDDLAAALAGLERLDASTSWLTSSQPPPASPFLRSYRVLEELTGSDRAQRRQLSGRAIAGATVKCRDVDLEPRTVLRRLGLRESSEAVILVTRRAGRTISLVVEPALPRSG